jgi:hypothetical protein
MSVDLTVAIVSSVFTAIVGPIAVHFIKIKTEKGKLDVLRDAIANNSLVANKVEEIKDQTGADRVWITQFHNGGTFYPTGKSIQKFSMFYESVSQGTTSVQQNFQNIPISLLSKSINHLLERNVIAIPDFGNNDLNTYGLEYIAEVSGCKSTYQFSIKTIDGKFIGILGLDFVKEPTHLLLEETNRLLVEATTIGGVLYKK